MADEVPFGEVARVKKEVFEGEDKFGIIMGDILEKVVEQVAERFFRFYIFLSAMRAKAVWHLRSTIQAGLVFSQVLCFHDPDFG